MGPVPRAACGTPRDVTTLGAYPLSPLEYGGNHPIQKSMGAKKKGRKRTHERGPVPHAACGQAKPGAWATTVWGDRHGLFSLGK